MKYEIKNLMNDTRKFVSQGKIIILEPEQTAIVTVPPTNEDVFSIVKFEKKEKKKTIKPIMNDKE